MRAKGDRIDRPFPDCHGANDGVLASDGCVELAIKPLRDVLGGGVDVIEGRKIIDAAVVELLRKRLELLLRTDEIDSDRIGINAAAIRRKLCLDSVRVAVQRLGDAAVFAQEMRSLEARLDVH